MAIRGVALWLAVAYHETRNSPHRSLQPQYRQLMPWLGELNGLDSQASAVASGLQQTALA